MRQHIIEYNIKYYKTAKQLLKHEKTCQAWNESENENLFLSLLKQKVEGLGLSQKL